MLTTILDNMEKGHWDNFEDFDEYEKLDELPKRVTIRKPNDKTKVEKGKNDEQTVRESR